VIYPVLMVICIGPKGCGKTNLFESLTEGENYEFEKETLPTVGVNIFSIQVPKSVCKQKKIDVREIGGGLAPVWSEAVSKETDVIFVIDASNLNQVSEVACHLVQVIDTLFIKKCDTPSDTERRLCIVYTKVDTLLQDNVKVIRGLIRLDWIISHHSIKNILEIRTSAKTKVNFDQLINWIKQSTIPMKN